MSKAEFDELPTSEKNNGKAYFIPDAQGSEGEIGIDDELSDTSENPVQNKVIKEALDDKADLVDGKVPAAQLPSYVDDVLEYEDQAHFPATGEAGKIYVALDTNKTYRWSGSAYTEISEGLALGETSSTAYRGDRGKIAYDDSQANKAAIGDLTELETTEKSDLVGAINEVKDDTLTTEQMDEIKDAFSVNQPITYAANPVGCIIQMMAVTAPAGYLACDGTAYNIADYSRLAAFIKAQFGTANYFGGDGTTTFAVPDLRGEFLRGTGTNSHANQGSGASVGVHQDGTGHLYMGYQNGHLSLRITPDLTTRVTNTDKVYETATHYSDAANMAVGTLASNETYRYTSRPTNTSVLYCIKY